MKRYEVEITNLAMGQTLPRIAARCMCIRRDSMNNGRGMESHALLNGLSLSINELHTGPPKWSTGKRHDPVEGSFMWGFVFMLKTVVSEGGICGILGAGRLIFPAMLEAQ